jgi:hypothetical protein
MFTLQESENILLMLPITLFHVALIKLQVTFRRRRFVILVVMSSILDSFSLTSTTIIQTLCSLRCFRHFQEAIDAKTSSTENSHQITHDKGKTSCCSTTKHHDGHEWVGLVASNNGPQAEYKE